MDQYEVIAVIGRGSFGTVSKIRRIKDGKILVWKEMDYGMMSDKEKTCIISEVNILNELRHPNIIRYYDRIVDRISSKIYIIMEYVDGGDLHSLIKKRRRDGKLISEAWIWRTLTQIILALKECHRHINGSGAGKTTRCILHRDVKPSNIFMDRKGNVKLGDFGLARELSSTSRFATTYVGTPYYMSPEIIAQSQYDERSDVWALGCLMYEIAALRPPFQATNQLQLAMKINSGRFSRLPIKYSEGFYSVIRWMLHKDINQRPRITDLEKIAEIRPYLTEYKTNLREFQLQMFVQKYTTKLLDIERRERELKKRQEALKTKELDIITREMKVLSVKQCNNINVTTTSTATTRDKENRKLNYLYQCDYE